VTRGRGLGRATPARVNVRQTTTEQFPESQ